MRAHHLAAVLLSAFLPAQGLRHPPSTAPTGKRVHQYASKRRGTLKDVCYRGQRNFPQTESCVKGERLIFHRIPKNAATAIERAAARRGVEWGAKMEAGNCFLKNADSCFATWHTASAFMNDINVAGNASTFCVVRNPYTRALSEFKHVARHPDCCVGREIFEDSGDCTVKTLNQWLVTIMKRMIAGYSGLTDCYMIPQAYYIWGPPDQRGEQCKFCHEVIRLEDFPHSFNSLMDRYNYNIELQPEEIINKGTCENLGLKDFNSTTIELIQRVFSHDFSMLGYSTDVSAATSVNVAR